MEKTVPITEYISLRIWPNNWSRSMEAVFLSANWRCAANFIVFIQLRTHCVHN